MHRYWAAGHPQDYAQLKLDDEWMDKYREEVPWAMAQADAMIGRLAAFAEANPGYEIWIASSMGQGPTFAQPLETQLYLEDLATFMRVVGGVAPGQWTERPAMRPQRNVCVDPDYADSFERALRRVTVAGAPLAFRRADNGFFSMEWGHANLHDRPDAVRIDGRSRVPGSLGLKTVEIEERSDTTAYHVPEGILAIYNPQERAQSTARPEVSVLEIAPTILTALGVSAPNYMVEPTRLAADSLSAAGASS
jgi:hypothetical protein